MRHNKSGRKFNRSSSHRRAMFRNMARALLTYEKIRTTETKAKELRKVVDALITLAVRNDLHSRRLAYKELGSHQMVQKLFDEIGPRYAEGGGGYTRIVKLSLARKGDAAPMVIIELTKREGAEEPKPAQKTEKKAEKKAAPKKAAAKKAAPKKAADKDEAEGEEKPKKAAPKKAAPKKAAAKKAAPKKAAPKKAAPKKEEPKEEAKDEEKAE